MSLGADVYWHLCAQADLEEAVRQLQKTQLSEVLEFLRGKDKGIMGLVRCVVEDEVVRRFLDQK